MGCKSKKDAGPRRGRKLLLLALAGLAVAYARKQQAPEPPELQAEEPAEAPEPPAPEPAEAPEPPAEAEIPAPAHEADAVSDPLVDPLDEGPATGPDPDSGSFFEQVMAETENAPRRRPRRTPQPPADADPS